MGRLVKTRASKPRALATGEGKGEEYVSRTVGFVRQEKRSQG
jgi:hypothetical protein